jgi:hypothetical protein
LGFVDSDEAVDDDPMLVPIVDRDGLCQCGFPPSASSKANAAAFASFGLSSDRRLQVTVLFVIDRPVVR